LFVDKKEKLLMQWAQEELFTVKSFFEALSFFLRHRLTSGYISAVGVGGDWLRRAPKINSTSKKELIKISNAHVPLPYRLRLLLAPAL
jgi:hypothetical protein